MWDGIRLFAALSTQWNYASAGLAGGGFTGLKYETVPIVASGLSILTTAPDWPRIFSDLQTLEREALSEFAKRRA